jgi:hypothetical protein
MDTHMGNFTHDIFAHYYAHCLVIDKADDASVVIIVTSCDGKWAIINSLSHTRSNLEQILAIKRSIL